MSMLVVQIWPRSVQENQPLGTSLCFVLLNFQDSLVFGSLLLKAEVSAPNSSLLQFGKSGISSNSHNCILPAFCTDGGSIQDEGGGIMALPRGAE